jgi:hypothetical protein
MGHIIDLEIAGVSGMDLVDDSRDGFAVGAAMMLSPVPRMTSTGSFTFCQISPRFRDCNC